MLRPDQETQWFGEFDRRKLSAWQEKKGATLTQVNSGHHGKSDFVIGDAGQFARDPIAFEEVVEGHSQKDTSHDMPFFSMCMCVGLVISFFPLKYVYHKPSHLLNNR